MGLEQQLQSFRAEFARTAPEGRVALYEAKIEELRASFAEDKAIGVGDAAPGFALPGIAGRQVVLEDLLRQGPVVLTFYRGGWCPYCNLELRAYQKALPEITALGARLVAISPETADNTLTTAEKNALSFDVLSDTDGALADALGIRFQLSPAIKALYQKFGHDLPTRNGDGQWSLPMPASYVIEKGGRIALASVDPDYRNRMDPTVALSTLRKVAIAS